MKGEHLVSSIYETFITEISGRSVHYAFGIKYRFLHMFPSDIRTFPPDRVIGNTRHFIVVHRRIDWKYRINLHSAFITDRSVFLNYLLLKPIIQRLRIYCDAGSWNYQRTDFDSFSGGNTHTLGFGLSLKSKPNSAFE